ncbi:HAD-IA family hydrolase [Candidatus Woesearchaeota archaeon]|jgi:HAD superfamily hydrolase (TIGR01549 family)|nr:HAD-IA family hydrolase [Candidatus Woesearchaeota archaeon]MBT6518432.1 HAD-IA family hydrolase [Candidatus Woesearchaeota archaeon]MBT7366600.1 HAD-IA family hydrolase [Candidatus Woesearchaeota archaeon]
MKKAVLFDLDDTLYEYGPVHKQALKASYSILKKKIKIDWEKFYYLFNLSKSEIHRELSGTAASHNRVLYFQRLIEKTHSTVDPKVILDLYNTYWNTFLNNMVLRKGVIDVLKKLKQRGIKIAVVSDLTTNIQLRKIHKLGITKYVDVLVTSEEAGSEKPHAIMFLLALNKLGISPHEAIMVGDNEVADIEGANFVGLYTALLSSKRSILRRKKEDFRKPSKIIKNISSVLDLLD